MVSRVINDLKLKIEVEWRGVLNSEEWSGVSGYERECSRIEKRRVADTTNEFGKRISEKN